jgi:hypothetical protein
MHTVKVTVFVLMFFVLATAGVCFAKDLQPVADSELDGIYARGLTYMIDANTMLGGSGGFDPRSAISLCGGAQANAFGVVNAVNSAVNMPINLVVVINSQVFGNITANNWLSALKQ